MLEVKCVKMLIRLFSVSIRIKTGYHDKKLQKSNASAHLSVFILLMSFMFLCPKKSVLFPGLFDNKIAEGTLRSPLRDLCMSDDDVGRYRLMTFEVFEPCLMR